MSTGERVKLIAILVATSFGGLALSPLLGFAWDLSIGLAVVVPLALAWVIPRYIIQGE